MKVSFQDMKAEFKRILIKKGFNEKTADESAQLFTETSCDGVYSHGVNRFPRIIEYIDKGYIDVNAEPTKIEGMGSFEKWDGNLGIGNLNAKVCMDRAIELAKTNAIGCVAIKNTNHWLRGGSYGWQAADAGCIGICWTNTLPNMPAWGGKDRRIGNNPLILSVPREGGHVVVDLAMAQFSYGKIESCKLNNELLPVVGGYDSEGNITRDPAEIEKTWRVLPIGYWKGSGLSILLDLIATVLSGGNSVYKVGQLEGQNAEYQLSQVFIAIDVKKIAGNEFLKSAVNEVLNDIKDSEKVNENSEVFYPGERTLNTRKRNFEFGIPVDERIWNTIKSM
jgi:3-dehydro-L-gulonate 2-dehydrogenase